MSRKRLFGWTALVAVAILFWAVKARADGVFTRAARGETPNMGSNGGTIYTPPGIWVQQPTPQRQQIITGHVGWGNDRGRDRDDHRDRDRHNNRGGFQGSLSIYSGPVLPQPVWGCQPQQFYFQQPQIYGGWDSSNEVYADEFARQVARNQQRQQQTWENAVRQQARRDADRIYGH